jgi:hypothetical protein
MNRVGILVDIDSQVELEHLAIRSNITAHADLRLILL